MAIAKWYKIDFHTHTPESRCFKDKNVTPTQWLNAAKSAGLDAVVITDHNSVGFISQIDQIQSNSETKIDIKVFYGMEICVSADFTHIIIIFDDKLTVTEIEDAVIGYLGLKRADWTNTEVNVSEDQLKKLCAELKDRIFVIPAHIASNKGLTKSNINAIKKYQEFISFSAYEVRNDDDLHEYENKLSQKVINSATLITGSDNPSNKDASIHSVDGIGKMFTWIKTAGISFEGLRQVFIDPENRCINYLWLQEIGIDFNPNEITYNYVGGISFSKISHMNDLDMRFSAGLNCIVGSRGTGKSTLVDAIHYGLNRSCDLGKCILLNKTLLKDGCITTVLL